ncbi:MAG: (d)CMP kinase [Bacteroidales bacterium]|nr:(d)CMP kinase [Bacteroidales bacterium]
MTPNKIIIAIDGYSSSGKSTMAKRLASKIGYRYIDTGAMYRAITLFALERNLINNQGSVDEATLQQLLPTAKVDFQVQPDGSQHTLLNGIDVEAEIRKLYVSNQVSTIAAIPFVRHALVALQQAMGTEKGIVMDGRDIGTTVFPNAELKIFVTASAQTRAQRRFNEMIEKGQNPTFEEILANVTHRDHIDETRAESPLRRADDALLLDNSHMTIEEQDAWLMDQYNKIIESKSMIS